MPTDTIFQMTGSTVRFGDGATREVGTDFVDLGCRRVLAFIDPAVRADYPGESALESLRAAGVEFDVFTDIRCEPTDGSFREAIAAASNRGFDGFLAVGGGSTIDTAKAINLLNGAEPIVHPVDLPGSEHRVIVEIPKRGKTDPRYPRNATVAKGKALS